MRHVRKRAVSKARVAPIGFAWRISFDSRESMAARGTATLREALARHRGRLAFFCLARTQTNKSEAQPIPIMPSEAPRTLVGVAVIAGGDDLLTFIAPIPVIPRSQLVEFVEQLRPERSWPQLFNEAVAALDRDVDPDAPPAYEVVLMTRRRGFYDLERQVTRLKHLEGAGWKRFTDALGDSSLKDVWRHLVERAMLLYRAGVTAHPLVDAIVRTARALGARGILRDAARAAAGVAPIVSLREQNQIAAGRRFAGSVIRTYRRLDSTTPSAPTLAAIQRDLTKSGAIPEIHHQVFRRRVARLETGLPPRSRDVIHTLLLPRRRFPKK